MADRKVDSRAMREVNRSIIYDLIRVSGQVSRTELAKRSSLTKPTVSAIVEELLAENIVVEVGFSKSEPTGGRRARLLEFNPDSAAYVGVRVGVRSTTVSLADGLGRILVSQDTATDTSTPENCLNGAAQLLGDLLIQAGVPSERISAVGIAIGGLIEFESGRCVYSPNLGFEDVPLRDLAEGIFDSPVVISNVTDAAALAEAKVGDQLDNFVWVYVGTGIGSAIYCDGQLLRGKSGFAGEIGFCRQSPDGPTLEEIASGRAMVQEAERRQSESDALRDIEDGLTIHTVLMAAEAGDEVAQDIVRKAGRALGLSVSHLVNIVNPGKVVLGGGIIEKSNLYFEEARKTFVEQVLGPDVVPAVRTSLMGRSVSVGSVQQAMEHAVRSFRIVAT